MGIQAAVTDQWWHTQEGAKVRVYKITQML